MQLVQGLSRKSMMHTMKCATLSNDTLMFVDSIKVKPMKLKEMAEIMKLKVPGEFSLDRKILRQRVKDIDLLNACIY